MKTICRLREHQDRLIFEKQVHSRTGKLLPKNGKYYVVILQNDNPDVDNLGQEIKMARQALKEYSERLPYRIKVFSVLSFKGTKEQVDVIIDFVDKDKFFTNNTLAWGGYPIGQYRGMIKFNNAYIWLDGKPLNCETAKNMGLVENCHEGSELRTYNFKQTLKHEFGHVLGLEHDIEGVMYYLYDFVRNMLSKNSVKILFDKYGRKIVTQRRLSRMLSWIKRVMQRKEKW